MMEQGNWELFKPAFALAIYDMVLFPFVCDMVDQAAIDTFAKFKRFRSIGIKPLQLSDWEKFFREVTPKNFGTKCRLYDEHLKIMYYCRDYASMMLMGPRGCITFTPALVLGQLKWGMVPVPPELLQGSMIWYKDGEANKESLISKRNALRKIRLYGKEELGEHQAYYTDEYKKWRSDRMKLATLPPPTRPLEPPGPSENELLLAKAQQKEEINLKRDYISMCSTSEKCHLIRVGKERDEKIAKLIRANEEKDEQISDLSHQLKARDDWLRTFEEAQGELQMYPETELRPTMRAFYETCDGLA
ncbi:hypothetical protein Lal_00019616 [Lupinus albus]|nr:hypothetical protein Lal_00019616 [Lupinus albus]